VRIVYKRDIAGAAIGKGGVVCELLKGLPYDAARQAIRLGTWCWFYADAMGTVYGIVCALYVAHGFHINAGSVSRAYFHIFGRLILSYKGV
jgi:hypothetical protein